MKEIYDDNTCMLFQNDQQSKHNEMSTFLCTCLLEIFGSIVENILYLMCIMK